MKICGFEVINNGMTNEEYGAMTFVSPAGNEYLISNKRLDLYFLGAIDKENGTITVTDEIYQKLVEVDARKSFGGRKFYCQQMVL